MAPMGPSPLIVPPCGGTKSSTTAMRVVLDLVSISLTRYWADHSISFSKFIQDSGEV